MKRRSSSPSGNMFRTRGDTRDHLHRHHEHDGGLPRAPRGPGRVTDVWGHMSGIRPVPVIDDLVAATVRVHGRTEATMPGIARQRSLNPVDHDRRRPGLIQRRFGNRAKSLSKETSVAPREIASAARWASEVRFPPVPALREQPFQMTPMFVRLSYQTNRRLAEPAVDPPTRLLDGERSWEGGGVRAQAQEPGDDGPGETDRLIAVERGFPPRARLDVMRGRRVDGVEDDVQIDERHLRCSSLRSVSASSSCAASARARSRLTRGSPRSATSSR